MAKKTLFKHAFSAGLTAAPTKTITGADGQIITLYALPILPASPFRTTDSRSGIEYSYDAEALIALYRAKGRRLALDIEHNTEGAGADTRARGWSVDLTTADLEPGAGLEPGPLYGWFELTPLGAQELGDKLYGYTSGVALGVWLDESHVQFTRIKSLALTNNPATEMPMSFSAEPVEDEDDEVSVEAGYTAQQALEAEMLSKILEQLGLAADADEATVVAAIAALTAAKASADEASAALTAAGIADVAAVATFAAQAASTTEQLTAATTQLTAAQGQVAALTAELTTLKAAAAEQAAVAAVDAALTARKITPAQRDAMLTFARADAAAFSAAMGAAQPVLNDTRVTTPAGSTEDAAALTDDDQAFLRAFGFKAESLIKAKQQIAAE